MRIFFATGRPPATKLPSRAVAASARGEEAAEVVAPRVGAEGDDARVLRKRGGDAERGGDGGAARAADEEPFFSGETLGRRERLAVEDLHDLVDRRAAELLGGLEGRDALDRRRLPRDAGGAGLRVRRDAHEAQARELRAEGAPDAADRSAAADAGDEG